MNIYSDVSQVAPLILDEVKKAKHILLHLHPSPDPDSIGSALATYHVLKGLGKDVTVIKGDSHTPEAFSAFPGYDIIVKKNYFELDLSQFDLFMIQDAGSLGQISKYETIVFPAHLNTVVIDHHATTEGYGNLNFLNKSYASTTEMLYDLFIAWNIKITEDIAVCLLAGLYGDTGGFQYANTRPETFATAGKLRFVCPKYSEIIFSILNSRKENEIRFWGVALSEIHKYFGGQVALSEVPHDLLLKNGIGENEIPEPISWMLRSVVGWNIVVTVTEKHPGIVSFSFRTRDAKKYDVSKLAAKLGGGGHIAAAGATLKKSFAEAKADLLKAIAETYPDLGQA